MQRTHFIYGARMISAFGKSHDDRERMKDVWNHIAPEFNWIFFFLIPKSKQSSETISVKQNSLRLANAYTPNNPRTHGLVNFVA